MAISKSLLLWALAVSQGLVLAYPVGESGSRLESRFLRPVRRPDAPQADVRFGADQGPVTDVSENADIIPFYSRHSHKKGEKGGKHEKGGKGADAEIVTQSFPLEGQPDGDLSSGLARYLKGSHKKGEKGGKHEKGGKGADAELVTRSPPLEGRPDGELSSGLARYLKGSRGKGAENPDAENPEYMGGWCGKSVPKAVQEGCPE
ncbi:hypothetical protein VFPPC_14856 [Pochonia chlamydosporia 170]|uniref:Uncharacterized protein n=1 Tax=Pochonia chlamydosporia 170 TaxID=1380566 RepID=A0A179EZV7_METCM|nr:hypothetical protein VFPPC_14856 [Pochonia chlamydosporia 170]OAQ58735.1 hypothetical protein VFPPC_14856 [Pochonia chlamydosporia 170]